MKIIVEQDDNPGVVAVYVGCEKLTPEELAQVMVPLLNDTLGESPAIGDIMAIQRGMMGALS